MERRRIEVVPYNPKWKDAFEQAKRAYEDVLRGIECQIEHVGSTSVQGLWAKPILDIDIIVQDVETSRKVIEALLTLGYEHVGNYGVKNREVMNPTDSYEPEKVTSMEHHLYVCMEGSENVINHLLIRKHLRENPRAVEAYSRLKRQLATDYTYDIDSYIDGKTALILGFLEAEGMPEEALERIRKINEK